MNAIVRRASLAQIEGLRQQYCEEANCQIVRFTNLTRGFAYPIAVETDGKVVAYGAVRTTDDEDALIEYHCDEDVQSGSDGFVREILRFSGAPWIESQSNIPTLQAISQRFGIEHEEGPILFRRGQCHEIRLAGASFRPRGAADVIFAHSVEPIGDWVVEFAGRVVATGGCLTHYNAPYADLFMEVEQSARRCGFGSFLLQELQKVCASQGLIPAARCDHDNIASARCLVRSGMEMCGRISRARVNVAMLASE